MRQIREPDMIRRAGTLCIIDADYGYRNATDRRSEPHVVGNATRRAIQRAHDPILSTRPGLLGEKAKVRS